MTMDVLKIQKALVAIELRLRSMNKDNLAAAQVRWIDRTREIAGEALAEFNIVVGEATR